MGFIRHQTFEVLYSPRAVRSTGKMRCAQPCHLPVSALRQVRVCGGCREGSRPTGGGAVWLVPALSWNGARVAQGTWMSPDL